MKRSFLPPAHRGSRQHLPAFSLVEILVVIVVLAVLAAVAVPALVGVRTAASESKLRSDVNHLNHAIDAYTAEGGRLDEATTAEQVIAKLKTKLGSLAARRHVGPVTGRVVDPRLAIRQMNDAEEQSASLRVVWNSSQKRFEVTRQGAGIASFYFDDAKAGNPTPEEERDRTKMLYNRADGWIWEWSEQGPPPSTAPAEFALAASPDPAPPSEGGGTSDSSSDSSSSFAPTPEPLPPPTILPLGGVFSVAQFPSSIHISMNGSDTRYSALRYRLNNGSWQPYTSAFSVKPGTRVYAKNISLDPARFTDSNEDSEAYFQAVPMIIGTVIPLWADMAGRENLQKTVSNLNVDDIKAAYGTPTESDQPPNTLRFKRIGVISVPPDTDFNLGQVAYFNGTVAAGTEATAVDLKLNIQVSSPVVQSGKASVHLSLWSSTNTSDARASADYAQLENPRTDFVIQKDGVTYTLKLRFANVKVEEGWTDGTRLHVYEGFNGHADLIGRFESSY